MTRRILRIVTSLIFPAVAGLTAPAIAQQSAAINRGVSLQIECVEDGCMDAEEALGGSS
jgi:hypothetical protein